MTYLCMFKIISSIIEYSEERRLDNRGSTVFRPGHEFLWDLIHREDCGYLVFVHTQ